MITEEKLPLLIKSIDCDTGCVEAVYRTVIKRDGVVIHTINDHQYVKVENAEAGLVEIERAVLLAIDKRDEALVLAEAEAQAQTEPQPEEENV